MSETPMVYFTDTIQELASFVHSSALDRDGPGIRATVEGELRQTAAEVAQGLGWAAHGTFVSWEPTTGGENALIQIVEVPVYTQIRRNLPTFPSPPPAHMRLPLVNVIITLPLRPLAVDGQLVYGALYNRVLYLVTHPEPLLA